MAAPSVPINSGQILQLGIESSSAPGTAVKATKKMLSWGIDIMPEMTIDKFRPIGLKYDTIATVNKDWTGGTITGRMSYDELTYLLASNLTTPTPTVSGAGTLWTYNPSSTVADSPVTFTLEEGVGAPAVTTDIVSRATGCVVSEIGMKIDRNGQCDVSGTIIGGYYTKDEEFTSGAAPVSTSAPIVMQPNQANVYLDNTWTAGVPNFGTTQLLNAESVDIKIASRFEAWWTLATGNKSFSSIAENVPAVDVTLSMAADEVSVELFDKCRLGAILFMQVKLTGPLIGGSTNNQFVMNLALKVTAAPKKATTGNVLTHQWSFTLMHDNQWGQAMQVLLTNNLPTTALTADVAATATQILPAISAA